VNLGEGGAWTHVTAHQSAPATSGSPDPEVKVPLRNEVKTKWTASHARGMKSPTN
jgi:hypothetical protein